MTTNENPPINAAHEVLLKSDNAMCVEDVARAIVGKKPTKADIKPVAKLLKELADLGLIEMEPRAGGVPFYRLIVAPEPAVCDSVQVDGPAQTEAPEPERVLTPGAQAERDQFIAEYGYDGNCSCHISPPCGSCTHPGNPRNQDEDESCWMAEPADDPSQPLDFGTSPELQYLAPEDYEMPPADPVLLAKANKILGERLDGVAHVLRGCGLPALADVSGAEDLQPKVAALAGAYQMAIAEQRERTDIINCACSVLERIAVHLGLHKLAPPDEMLDAIDAAMSESARLRSENLALKAVTGFGAEHYEQRIDSLTKDVINTRTALTNAINEADRLRGEIAAALHAHDELLEQISEQSLSVDDAVGYLIRVPKRKPRFLTSGDRVSGMALAAVRNGASRAEVLALVPVGTARRGPVWRAIPA